MRRLVATARIISHVGDVNVLYLKKLGRPSRPHLAKVRRRSARKTGAPRRNFRVPYAPRVLELDLRSCILEYTLKGGVCAPREGHSGCSTRRWWVWERSLRLEVYVPIVDQACDYSDDTDRRFPDDQEWMTEGPLISDQKGFARVPRMSSMLNSLNSIQSFDSVKIRG